MTYEEQFQPFDFPKNGIFQVLKTPNEYKLPGGWVLEDVELKIIGQTEDCYIKKVIEVEYGVWVGNKVFPYKGKVYLGPHKSRFVKWVPSQLQLFNF